MKKSKQIISILLAVIMLVCAVPMAVSAADSGQCGNNVYWTLDGNGTLTISGNGAMWNYTASNRSPFDSNYAIKKVIIENGVTTIGNYAFHYCPALQSVEIPNSVTTIVDGAFAACVSLTSVKIPDSVSSIGSLAFDYCLSLTRIEVAEGNQYYTSVDGVLFNKNKTKLIQYAVGNKRTEYIIPNSVTTIGLGAFSDCDILTRIIIPNSVTSIEDFAFYDCNNLTDIYYNGSEMQWKNIAIGSNESLTNANIHFVTQPILTTLINVATGITLTYNTGVLDENVSLVVAPLSDSVGNEIFKDEFSSVSAYDISLEKDGAKVQPNGKVTVKMPLPEGYNADTTAVYYVPANGDAEKLESTYDNGYIVFETNHFSEYVLVDESSKVETPTEPSDCDHICHKGGFTGFIYKIICIFWKLFGINKTCACGVNHY